MQDTLKIALIQSNLIWEDPSKNRSAFEDKINTISDIIDIIVLPEMFSTGFTMAPNLVAETMEGETIGWMKALAAKVGAALCGSLIISENENYYNRFVFVSPNGEIESYDKRHTFTLAGEDKVYKAGTEKKIIHYKGWSICPLICYDLRFPVWARNTENYDLLLYMANWPKPRINAWDALLKARAIENMSFTIGVNRIGTDGNQLEYNGHSGAFDALGNELTNIEENKESITVVEVDIKRQNKIRETLRFLDDGDRFNLIK